MKTDKDYNEAGDNLNLVLQIKDATRIAIKRNCGLILILMFGDKSGILKFPPLAQTFTQRLFLKKKINTFVSMPDISKQ